MKKSIEWFVSKFIIIDKDITYSIDSYLTQKDKKEYNNGQRDTECGQKSNL